MFDIYRTMRVLLAWPDAPPGDATPSLLEPMPEGRTCADAGIPDMYCACRNPEAQRSFSAVVEAAHGGAVPASAGAATGLPTAKAAVEAVPNTIGKGMKKEDAEAWVEKIKAVGGHVELE